MRRLIVLALVGIVGLLLAAPVLALDLSEQTGSRPGLLKQDLVKQGRAAIGSGTLKSKSGNTAPATLVVTAKDGKDYTVNVDDKTQLRRRFWGKATLAELAVGDTLNIIGLWTDDTHTTVNAKLIRDLSIQKRFGVFVGQISALTSSGWTMITIQRGSQSVTISPTTKLVNRKEKPIVQADIKVGDKVRVKGLWDSKANTITEVSHVKDYSLIGD